MNLILLHKKDFISDNAVRLSDRRAEHIKRVHRAENGDTLTVGVVNGNMGTATVTALSDEYVELSVSIDTPPPRPLDCTLVLALPRPKSLKKALHAALTMGIKKIYLINSYRVEKSYWQSPLLSEKQLNDQIELALEQSKDTVYPEIIIKKRFKPFVEDELPEIIKETTALVGHPIADNECPRGLKESTTLVVGPEGGFIPYEIELLKGAGVKPVSMGAHILRVEVAIPALLGKIF